MVAFTKPTKLPEWASGGTADVVEPTAGEKSLGWVAGQTPPAPYMNWLMGGDFGYFPWLQYVSTFEQQALTWPERQTFQKGFAASGVRSTIDGLDVTGGQTVAGGLTTDTVTASGAAAAASLNVGTGSISGGAFTGAGATFTSLTVTGPVSSGAVTATTGTFSGNVAAPNYGAVNGTTGTFTGAVQGTGFSVSGTSGTFTYATGRTYTAFVDASEFAATRAYVLTVSGGGMSGISSDGNSVSFQARVRVPAVCTVTSFDHLFSNGAATAQSPSSVSLTRYNDVNGTSAPGSNQYVQSAAQVPFINATSTALWRNAPLTSNITLDGRGWIVVSFSLPGVVGGLVFYGARVTFTVNDLSHG